jgi:hypothetical protein
LDTIKANDKVFSIVYHTQIKSETYNMQALREEKQQASSCASLSNTFNYIKTNLGSLFEKVNFMHNKGMYLFTEASIYDKITEQFNFNATLPIRFYIFSDNTTIITVTIEPQIYSVEEIGQPAITPAPAVAQATDEVPAIAEVPVQETEVVKEVKKTPVRKAKTTASTESKAKPKREHERKENEKAAEKVTGTKKSK